VEGQNKLPLGKNEWELGQNRQSLGQNVSELGKNTQLSSNASGLGSHQKKPVLSKIRYQVEKCFI